LDSFEIYNSYVNSDLYPNLNIDFKGENAKLYNINIYNGDGKVVWHRKINVGAELNNVFLSEGPEGAFDISKIIKMNTLSSIFKFMNQWEVYNEDSGELLDTINASIPVYSSVNCNLGFIPVFNEELRKYTLTFYDVDGNVAEIKKEEPYGKLLSAVTRSAAPYKDDSELPYNQTYGFIGYGLTTTATSPVSSDYIIQSD
jgi:hypothetical protein